jgi:hypothetical protein
VSEPAYQEFAPPRNLRPFVQRLWVHDIDGPPPSEGRRLLPDGRVNVVWIGGQGLHVAGPQTRYASLPDVGRIVVVGAAFHPGAATQLLRTPAAAFVDEHVPLDGFDPRLAARLDDRIGSASNHRPAIAALADELSRALGAAAGPDPAATPSAC